MNSYGFSWVDIFDDYSRQTFYIVDDPKFLLTGNQLGDTNETCYLPIFRSVNLKQNTWYLGSLFLNNYYLVLDASPNVEQKLLCNTVGLAPINPENLIGSMHYDPSSPAYDPESQNDDAS